MARAEAGLQNPSYSSSLYEKAFSKCSSPKSSLAKGHACWVKDCMRSCPSVDHPQRLSDADQNRVCAQPRRIWRCQFFEFFLPAIRANHKFHSMAINCVAMTIRSAPSHLHISAASLNELFCISIQDDQDIRPGTQLRGQVYLKVACQVLQCLRS